MVRAVRVREAGYPLSHPIRDPEFQADVERWAEHALAEVDGTAMVEIRLNYKDWRVISYSLGIGMARERWTALIRGVGRRKVNVDVEDARRPI